MKKSIFSKICKKITASLLLLIMFSSYLPVMATVSDAITNDEENKQITNNIKDVKKEKDNNEEETQQEEPKVLSETGSLQNIESSSNNNTNTTNTNTSSSSISNDSWIFDRLISKYDTDKDGNLSDTEIERITELTISTGSDSVIDLTDIDKIYNLKKLYIDTSTRSVINGISTIGELSKLEEFTLIFPEHKGNIDMSFLNNLTNLKSLSIFYIDMSSIEWTKISSKLEKLSLKSTNLKNIDFIKRFTNLVDVDLANSNQYYYYENYNENSNDISDITPLTKLSNLKRLTINWDDKNSETIESLNLENLYLYESLEKYDIKIEKGKASQEVELPSLLKKVIDENSKLYIDNISIGNDKVTFNENRTKIIIDATNLNVGNQYISIYGNKNTYENNINKNINISIYGNYTVYENVNEKIEINIPNENFKKLLLKRYDTDKDNKITNYDMIQLKSISVDYDNDIGSIDDITGLEYAKNLETIYLYQNCKSISVLNKLTNLKSLNLYSENAYNLNELTILNNLDSLYISYYTSGTKQVDYNLIGSLVNLKQLSIYDSSRTQEVDMNLLKNLTNLERFEVNAKLINYNLISSFTKLNSLILHTGNIIDDIAFVSSLANLNNLDLSDNLISDITPLKGLEKLNYVNLIKNPINTKETENSSTLQVLKDKNVQINIVETNATSNIEFKDENFKNDLIKDGKDLNKDNQISIDEMQQIYSLNLSSSNNKITCMDELEYAINLDSLYIYKNIEDLTPISKLPKLTRLNLNSSNVKLKDEDLTLIAGLTKLQYLSLYDTKLNNLEIFSKMRLLQSLEIQMDYSGNYNNEGKILDLNGIDKLTNLRTLTLRGKVSNLELLKKLPILKSLTITNRMYNKNGEQFTNKQIVDFLDSLNLETVNFSIGQSIEINLENILVGSEKTVNLLEIDPLIKALYTKESCLYAEDAKATCNYSEFATLKDLDLTLNTEKIGEKNAYININSKKFYGSFNIKWRNYIQGDTTKEISIPDTELKNVLLNKYDIDNNNKITEHDLINIQSLNIENSNISNLAGLENAKNIENIYAPYNNISDLSPIANLEKLINIDINGNLITDVSILDNVKWSEHANIYLVNNFINFEKENKNYLALKNFVLKNTSEEYDTNEQFEMNINKQRSGDIKDIDNAVDLDDNLKKKLISYGLDTNNDSNLSRKELFYAEMVLQTYEIDLSNCNITDISGIEYISIGCLDLSGNNIIDITPITKNNNIYEVNLSNNNIINISGIENCYELTNINLSNNKISDLEPLTKLHSMQQEFNNDYYYREVEIDLSNNEISNIDCVKYWKNLQKLDLSNNKITDISELRNYNFCLSKDMTDEEISTCAKNLIINLSGNNISSVNIANKAAKDVFDKIGAHLKLVDKTKATIYTINSNGYYSSDSNLGIVNTSIPAYSTLDYKFVYDKDRTYYPNGSDDKLAGIFMNTSYYNQDKAHEASLKANGFDVEMILTGAIKTESSIMGTPYMNVTLKVPETYIGNGAQFNGTSARIVKTTKDTITVEIPLKADSNDNCYYSINESIYLKIREQKIENVADQEEIINAIDKEQNVTLDMKEKTEEITNQVFETLSKKDNVDLKVQTENATWKFNSSDITNTNIELNPKVTLSDTKFENMDNSPCEDGIFIKFEHEGVLPGKAEIELDIKEYNIYEKGKTVYLYYYNSEKGKYQYVSTVTTEDKKVKITLEHCSEYVLLDKRLVTLGDINNDGRVNLSDVLYGLKGISRGTLTDYEIEAGNVNGDKSCNLRDMIKILNFIAGKITSLE